MDKWDFQKMVKFMLLYLKSANLSRNFKLYSIMHLLFNFTTTIKLLLFDLDINTIKRFFIMYLKRCCIEDVIRSSVF